MMLFSLTNVQVESVLGALVVIGGIFWAVFKESFVKSLGIKLWNKLIYKDTLTLYRLKNERKIRDSLKGLRVATGATRAQLWQFHNGGKFTKYRPKFKFTLTHESVGDTVSTQLGCDYNSDVHVSYVPEFLETVFSYDDPASNSAIFERVGNQETCRECTKIPCRVHRFFTQRLDNEFMQALVNRHGSHVVVYRAVTDGHSNDGRPTGIIMLHFGNRRLYEDNAGNIHAETCKCAVDVGFTMGTKNGE